MVCTVEFGRNGRVRRTAAQLAIFMRTGLCAIPFPIMLERAWGPSSTRFPATLDASAGDGGTAEGLSNNPGRASTGAQV